MYELAHAYIYDTKEESLQNPSVASATVSTTPTQQLASTTSSNTSSTTTSTGAASGGTSGTSGGNFRWRRRRWIRVLNK